MKFLKSLINSDDLWDLMILGCGVFVAYCIFVVASGGYTL